MRKTTKPKSPFTGRWCITWMDQWDQDFVDAEVEGFFEFRPKGNGEFQFGYVRGDIDYRKTTRDGKPCIEFTWDGNDEMDPAQGRCWAIYDGDELSGTIYIHHGDESDFTARRKQSMGNSSDQQRRLKAKLGQLKLGKGAAFVKSRLRDLPFEDDVWEADFFPQADCWMGLVIEKEHGSVFGMKMLEATPTVNDLASLLADAMQRPLVEVGWHRPRSIRLRDNPEWQELVPHLEELHIEVIFSDGLSVWDAAAADYHSSMKDL